MLDIQQIIDCLISLGGYTAEELDSYDSLIESARLAVESKMTTGSEEEVEKGTLLAAAKVNYELALIKQGADRVTSFKAGDVSITESNDVLENAQALLSEITSDCAELAGESGFVFQAV